MNPDFLLSAKKILVLVGPTASGKTEVACEISKLLPAEMISCDSMQVYRGMSIITQSPPKRVTKAFKTHLVSFLDTSKEYSAAKFRSDTLKLIPKILKRNKTPMIVGGTGLYLRALLDGLFETTGAGPWKDEVLRKKLLSEQESHGGQYLHEKLKMIDAVSAGKIHPNDTRRIVRALEVFYLTQKPISEQMPNRRGVRADWDFRIFLLNCAREELYDRINRRVDQMIRSGLEAEVKKIDKKIMSQTARMALGIREMKQFRSGALSLKEAVELLKKNTRNYAKRQLSWFRHEKGVECIDVYKEDTPKMIAEKILKSWARS